MTTERRRAKAAWSLCPLLFVAAATCSCDGLSSDQDASDRMRAVVTTVPVTRGLRLNPSDAIRTPDGRIYLANGWTSSVQEVSPGGEVTEVAVSTSHLARDGRGRVFCIVDSGIAEIRRDGEVAILAGARSPESATRADLGEDIDGPISVARFHRAGIRLIAADREGNIYVQEGDLPDAHVRKIGTDGVVTTLVRQKRIAQRTNHWGWRNFAADSSGALYFGADNAVIKLDNPQKVQDFAGDESRPREAPRDGVGMDARFATIHDLRIDGNDNIYVMTFATIRKITPEGVVTTVLKSGCRAADFPSALAAGCTAGLVDGSLDKQIIRIDAFDIDDDGNIYYVDRSANALRKVTPTGMLSTIVRGEFPEHP